ERGVRHPRRGLAVVPRPRHPAARRVVGQHDQRGPRLSAIRAVDRVRPGRGAVRDGGRPELRGRRHPRRARSALARLSAGPARYTEITMPAKNPDLHGNAPDKAPVVLLMVDVINDMEYPGG